MKVVAPILMLAAVCSAAVPNVVKPEPNQRFSEVVGGADYVLIRTGGNCHRDPASEKTVFEATGGAAVGRIAQLFGFTGEYTNAFLTTWEGEEALAISNCLCCGTHTFSFRKRGTEVLSISIHHWSHARPTGDWESKDINLTKDSIERLQSFLRKLQPVQGKAIQSSQRNAGAGPTGSNEAPPLHPAAPSEKAARPQPPRG